MKAMIFIKPVAGRNVRDPEDYTIIPPEGKEVEKSGFWLRRIREGDVIESISDRDRKILQQVNDAQIDDESILTKPKAAKGAK